MSLRVDFRSNANFKQTSVQDYWLWQEPESQLRLNSSIPLDLQQACLFEANGTALDKPGGGAEQILFAASSRMPSKRIDAAFVAPAAVHNPTPMSVDEDGREQIRASVLQSEDRHQATATGIGAKRRNSVSLLRSSENQKFVALDAGVS